MNNIIINSITIAFLIVIVLYSVINIILNKNLYNFISEDLIRLNENYKISLLYSDIKNKYSLYILENSHADINIASFIEEICASLKFKNRFVLDKIKRIKNASSTCILLGVLGTFIGLSMMLLSINTSDIINSLPETISSMQTAFITSIFGIVCSIILNLIIGYHDCEHILIQLMLKMENLLTSEITHQKSQDIDNKIEDVKSSIKEISISIKSIERFDQISKDLTEFNSEFINGIETLKELLDGSQNSIKIFDQNVRKLDKQFSIMNMKFTKLFDTYDNQSEINKEILLDIKETSKNISESNVNQLKMKDYLRTLSANFALYERSAQDLLNKLVEHENKIIKNQGDLNEEQVNLDTTVKHLASVIAISSQDIEQKLNMIFDYIDIYKEASTINAMQNDNYKKYSGEEIYDMEKTNESNEIIKSSNKYPSKTSASKKSYNKFRRKLIGDDRNGK
ncbi:MotA/TolQ/ExbB proton channel family protein [Clostridium sp. CCUG 7971]|uniref:MotA/TolQ/ExbB proton channel family protein n=1 Tax=Clostridium sp. CCUG 7971 TaxID=2811414 RepID=UPI001ABB0766|nr:MotA/TolQ/ExbB proton channel family protein [Clostridium sp. CCUG 7971]MBO3445937.1 MotA/TolQ/ExbB proton channel family protein [Clostridium sp. CCUG 7971]